MTRFWKILYFIRGDVYITQMQNRTFNIVSFISALINLAAFINNMSIDVHPINLYLSLFGFIVYSVFYYLSRFVVYHNFYPTVYFIFTQIYLSVFWFVNAGSQGVVLTLWVAALPMYMANTANRYQMILVATVILNINLLYLLEYLYPQWVIPYNDVGTRMLDLGITNSVIITGLAICVYIYKNGFDEEREKNERNLLLVSEAKSEIRVQKIIQNSIDAVVSTNIDGQIMEWNMAATKLFGYTLAEVKNKKLSELIIPPHLRNNFENAVNYFSNKTNFIRFETNAVNAEGVYFPVELSLTLIEYDNKKVLNFFIRNLQEQKNNEKKILDQNEQLKSLYEEMDLLIYRSSHDLRGPVTNIEGFVELIKREVQNNALDDYFLNVQHNINKLKNILDQLNEYSKNHRNNISLEIISIKPLVANIEKVLLEQGKLNKEYTFNISEIGNYNFVSDKKRLEIVLLNILENAIIYHGKEGPINIDLLLIKESSKIILRIKDNGMGMQPDQLDKIFDMFYRGSNLSEGAGLGLYIVKRILSRLQGSIKVTSDFGQGTEFVIEMPNFAADKSLDYL